MVNDEIMVSICCLVYNHEKYLRKCLDGFLMQKTNFKFEVLIHDDASTDNSVQIIREYQEKYPDIIKPIYQTENQYSKGVKITMQYQFSRAKGKYIALCEGDDYWTDASKLQLQYECMEKNLDCSVCVHNVVKMNEEGISINEKFPPLKYSEGIMENEVYLNDELVGVGWIFQTASYFFRNSDIQQFCKEKPEFYMESTVGDLPFMLYAITKGKIYYIDRDMANYRMNSCFSVTKENSNNTDSWIKYAKGQIKSLNAYDQYTNYKFHHNIEPYLLRCESGYLLATEQYAKIVKNKKYYIYMNKIGIIQSYVMTYCPFVGKCIIFLKRKICSFLNKR